MVRLDRKRRRWHVGRPVRARLSTNHGSARRAAAALVALALAGLGCRTQPHPVPGGSIAIALRVVSDPAPGAVRASVSVPGTAGAVLRPDGPAGELRGAIPVAPGDHPVTIEAYDAAEKRIGALTMTASVPHGGPLQIAATVGAARPGPRIEVLEVSGASAVAGQSLQVAARLSAASGKTVAARWEARPAGCGRFADPDSLATAWTAEVAGTCALTLEVRGPEGADRRGASVVVRTRGEPWRYPLRASPDGRFLLDARGNPFLIKGESAWLALANLTEAEQEAYLADRAAKGFNLVEIMLFNHGYTEAPNPTPPANRRGEEPFLKAKDFATPNDAYFDRAVAFVDRAAAHGLAVLLAPVYLGYDGGPEGWWEELNAPANTRAVCAAFGRYLGSKFRDRKNLVWLAGGDFSPPAGSEGEARHREILEGIREAGASQPWTGHWNFEHVGGISTDEALFAPDMALNGVYQYANTYRFAARAWEVTPPRPVFLLESAFEREHGKSRLQPFRKAWWWAMSSGGSGVVWGNSFLWMCESTRGRYRALYGDSDGTLSSWAEELDSPGTHEALYLHAFFEGIAWQRLVPAGVGGLPELVRSGQGSGSRHIAVAASREGDLLVAYLPPDGTGARGFTLDLASMRRPARARWYDPSTGAFLPGGTLAPSREAALVSPGKNASGVNDWVLLVDTPEPGE